MGGSTTNQTTFLLIFCVVDLRNRLVHLQAVGSDSAMMMATELGSKVLIHTVWGTRWKEGWMFGGSQDLDGRKFEDLMKAMLIIYLPIVFTYSMNGIILHVYSIM